MLPVKKIEFVFGKDLNERLCLSAVDTCRCSMK